jgi:hypothetical protein
MGVDKISPNDPRVTKDFKEVNGRKWCKHLPTTTREQNLT